MKNKTKVSSSLCFAAFLLLSFLVPAGAYANQFALEDGASVAIGTTETTLATLSTSFLDADNFVIAIVQFESSSSAFIAAGDLHLERVGGATLMSNKILVDMTNTAPDNQKWYALMGIDTTGGWNPKYAVKVTASATGISGEAKILAINGVTGEEVQNATEVSIDDDNLNPTVISTLTTTGWPAGDNIVLAIFETYNTSGSKTPDVWAVLKRTGKTPFASLCDTSTLHHGTAGSTNDYQVRLYACLDVDAPADPEYYGDAWQDPAVNPGNLVDGFAKIVALQKGTLQAAFEDDPVQQISTASVQQFAGMDLSSPELGDPIADGSDVAVIASGEFVMNTAAVRSIASGDNRLQYEHQTVDQTVNEYTLSFPEQNTGDNGKSFALLNSYPSMADASGWLYLKGMASGDNLYAVGKILAIASSESPAQTTLFNKVGTFAASGPTQSVTGVGFVPKAVIFFWTPQSAVGFASHAAAGYGFAAEDLTQRAVLFAEDDNRTSPNFNGQSMQTAGGCILMATGTPPSGGATTRAQLTGMTSDGFDLSWSVAPPSAYLIHYVAIGGGDVTDATIGTQKPAAGTGPESFTGVGFQPDLLMFLSIDNDAVDSWVAGGGTYTGAKVSIGFAGNSGGAITQGAITATAMARGQVNAISTVWQQSDSTNDRALLEKNTRSGLSGKEFEAQVTSFDADGFTLDKIINTAGTETNFHYLALKGGRYDVGPITKPVSTGSQAYTGVGFMPRGLMFFSFNCLASTGVSLGAGRISFSAADSTGINQAATFFATETDNPADSDNSWVRQATSTSKVIYLAQPGDCPSTWPEGAHPLQCSAGPRLIADADVTSYDADGFTLDWTTADNVNVNSLDENNNAEIICVAFGNTTTSVDLASFTATGYDREVLLQWETASELDNLGFNLYRAASEEGPYEKITAGLIPGLGSSPRGATYSYRDTGLDNGETYFYKLEDVETTGQSELHGPVSATPSAGASAGDGGSEGSSERSESEPTPHIVYGDPSANRFQTLHRRNGHITLELVTEGFYATAQPDGSVRLEVPDFVDVSEAGSPAIPVYRSWVEAVAGRKVEVVSVRAEDVEAFSSLRPSLADNVEIEGSRSGTARVSRRKVLIRGTLREAGLYPAETARVVSVAFQQEVKKALVEIAPLRWDPGSGRLLLARRMVVQIAFEGREASEITVDGRRGRRPRVRRSSAERRVVTRLATVEKGLHRVSYEEVFGWKRGGIAASSLRLSRQGESVAFHIEPDGESFNPGSMLYFVSEGAAANPYGDEAVYELETSREGEPMAEVSGAPSGSVLSYYWKTLAREETHAYQAALVHAPDVWLWDVLMGGMRKRYAFDVSALAESPEPSRIEVWLQGTSDFPQDPDHHLRIYVNGTWVAEASWDGKRARRLSAELGPGLLEEGENFVELENVGDTGATYSMVMLDRFALTYPRLLVSEAGRLEGAWSESGTAVVSGMGSRVFVVDVTGESPQWLSGAELTAEGVLQFRAEADRSYMAVSQEAVLRPVVRIPSVSRLKDTRNRADYLVIGPKEFLSEAEPLLDLRRSQGLATRAVPIEEIYSEFGHGEATPQSVQDFLAYAYHEWRSPSVRYVLLVGDGTYDFKDYAQTGVTNHVPPLMVKTTYLWTVSDPAYASVNGEDELPDLAIGRLPAATVEEARLMVEKILTYERSGLTPKGPVVLVADNPDPAGDFVANAEEIATSLLGGNAVRKIYLPGLGTAATRSAILQAFDEGAALMSYIGHGGIQLWAHENLFDIFKVGSLAPQAEQPLLLTMNCLNGYFHFPYFNSLAEELLKADGKGVIAAFSPSGLSLNAPADIYHKALLNELFHQGHTRLGDAVLAAQTAYADTGAFPELLSIYHLLGDPALTLR